MNTYPQAFEDKPKALELKERFSLQSDEVSELISKLLRPASTIHRPKQDSQQKLAIALQENIGMGILLATHLEDKPLLDILKVYKSRIANVSAYRLFEMAGHVAEELQKYAEVGIEFGLTAEKLTAFNTQISDFGETLDQTGAKLSIRKSDWNALNKQLLLCSKTIRLQLDPFIEFNEKEFPDLFKDYMLVRGSRKRRKKIVVNDPTSGDISGVVTDSLTGLPIANATINLVEHESAYTTDADGYYLIDEIEAGPYTVSCHANGYDVPEHVTTELAAGESVVINFSLVPMAIPLNN
jgi:hypothetical protein